MRLQSWIQVVLVASSVGLPAWAEEAVVGKVSVVDGKATRTPGGAAGAAPVSLAAATPIHMLDTLEVAAGGNLKFVLNDGSEICVGAQDKSVGAQLVIDKATFKDQERSEFSATLGFGKIWSKVTKALSGSNAKFNVVTDRAVAGVRGTIFRVDAVKFVGATKPNAPSKSRTFVRVTEGKVGVDAQVKLAAADKKATTEAKGPRKQVAGPKQISKDEWEKKFVELQKDQQVEVGEELWKEAKYDDSAKSDAFARFVDKNQ